MPSSCHRRNQGDALLSSASFEWRFAHSVMPRGWQADPRMPREIEFASVLNIKDQSIYHLNNLYILAQLTWRRDSKWRERATSIRSSTAMYAGPSPPPPQPPSPRHRSKNGVGDVYMTCDGWFADEQRRREGCAALCWEGSDRAVHGPRQGIGSSAPHLTGLPLFPSRGHRSPVAVFRRRHQH